MFDFKTLRRAYKELRKLLLMAGDLGAQIPSKRKSVFPSGLLLFAALNRSRINTSAFISMVKGKKYQLAATLIRLEMDSCLRLHALTLVADPELFATAVLDGKSVKDLRTKNNERMTDGFLKESLANSITNREWVKATYEEASSFIHLSSKHIHSAIAHKYKDGKGALILNFLISTAQDDISEKSFAKLAAVYADTTKLLLELVQELVSSLKAINDPS